ncbi:MAG: universal stress protein [Pseudomonadota bacterium]
MAAQQPDTRVITAGIDGSASSGAVCDAAAWASTKISAPIRFLHVLERARTPAREDLSGAIGLGSRTKLLDELTELDEKRGRLAMEHGKLLLQDARERAGTKGASDVHLQQRHGTLLEALQQYEEDTRLFVIGRLGADNEGREQAMGSQVETVVRAISRPILATVGDFTPPERWMLAYDGSEAATTAVARVARSPILKGLPGHVVMVGEDTNVNRAQLEGAAADLRAAGHEVSYHLVRGNIVESLTTFRRETGVGLTVMGAYGHSRFREFFVGSNTERMISQSAVPLLLLR